MDGGSEVISKPHAPPPLLNGHAPHLENGSTAASLDLNTTVLATNSENENAVNSLHFNSLGSDQLNMAPPLEGDVSLNIGLPPLPFPLPDIDASLLNSDFSIDPGNIDDLDPEEQEGENGFSFDSSMFNDDLVNSAIWSIGGNATPTLDDVPSVLSPTHIDVNDHDQPAPPIQGDQVNQAPHIEVYCMEDGFEDDFGPPTGDKLDPFVDLARIRALSTIVEGFEEEGEETRFENSGGFDRSPLNHVLTAFADANDFIKMNSDLSECGDYCKDTDGRLYFDPTATAKSPTPTRDWSSTNATSAETTAAPVTAVGGGESHPGGSEEVIGSPLSDGNQVGVSPETVGDSLTKPIGYSWQSVSGEDDVIGGGKSPSSSSTSQQEAPTDPSGSKFNPSSTVIPPKPIDTPPQSNEVQEDSDDDSSEYLRLSDFRFSPVSANAPGSAVHDPRDETERSTATIAAASTVEASGLPRSSESSKVTGQSADSADTVGVSHSNSADGKGIGPADIAVVTAASVGVEAMHGERDGGSSAPKEGGASTDTTPDQSGQQVARGQSQSTSSTPPSSATTSAQPPEQDLDTSSSSLDTGDRNSAASNLDHCPRESNLDTSNLDAGLRRNKNPNSTPPSQRRSHPVTNLPILNPLSPDHGTPVNELNEQYEFLRRTLSHSQRRYSERRKHRGQGGRTIGHGGRQQSNLTTSVDPSATERETLQKETVRQLRDLTKNKGAPVSRNQEAHAEPGRHAHVDHHGRTYYMDHNTRTIAYNGESQEEGPGEGERQVGVAPARRNPRELQTRREMLDRRYQSLQRSFRRSSEDRPSTSNFRRPSKLVPSASVTGGIDNMSLTLTRQEADAMVRSQAKSNSGGRSFLSRGGRFSSSVTERSSNKKQRSGSGSKSRWLFGRRSNKSISQQPASSGDDDFLPVFSPTGEGGARLQEDPPTSEGSSGEGLLEPPSSTTGERLTSQSSIASVESQTPLIPQSDSSSRDHVSDATAAVSSSEAAAASLSDNEQELTQSNREDIESIQRAEVQARRDEATSEEQPLITVVVASPRESVSEATSAETELPQRSEERGGSVDNLELEVIPNASPAISELGRQSSIVRSSGLLSQDRDAAVRARQRARSRSQVGDRRDSDEITNEVGAELLRRDRRERRDSDEITNEVGAELNRRSKVSASTGQEQVAAIATSGAESRVEGAESSPRRSAVIAEGKEKEAEATPKKKSKRSPQTANRGLYVSPGLRFITRKDLYTFLTSAGHAGEEFFANRALMELVQRIRSDNSLFEKYQHSRHLVNTLNQFADVKADLPSGWEKKLNKEGKVFFIDHEHELTTFVDPRLPLPNQKFSYTPIQASAPAARRVSYDDTGLRPHHTTTVRHSQSLDNDMAVATPTIQQGNSPAPPPPATSSSSPTPSQLSTASESSAGRGSESSGAGNRASLVSESVAPPTYEEQVVAFFRQADIVAIISGRYHRGVRPQLRDIIACIRMEGTPALERIQMSGSIATYELAIVLSLFEEEISRMNPRVMTAQPLPPDVNVVPPQSTPASTSTRSASTPSTTTTPPTASSPIKPPNMAALSTLQRKKLDFATKLQNFKIMMTRVGFSQGSRLKFNIRRDHLLEDAYEHTMKSNLKHLQMKRLNISFKGEEGLDYGGPSREFFFLLSREIFNPYYGLFEYSANDTYTVQISPTSSFLQNHLEWFRFAGRIVGLTIAQGFLLDVFFTRTVYKSLLCKPPHLKDLEALEPAFYNSLLWIQENDPEPLDLTFTVEEEAFGQVNSHELKEGGDDILVTEENKDEYIDLMLRWRLDRGVAKQTDSFKKGFCEVMPVNLLYNFDAQELEFLTAGTLEIDVEDWKAHTEYRNGYHAAHQVVLWFWQAVEMFDNEQRLRLLQFVTGTSSVPFEGFKALRGSNGPKRFCIDFFNDVNAFPRTHTCFNRIDLPPYPSFEVLYEKLRFAVEEGGGFGIE